jgi:hypothetical protein
MKKELLIISLLVACLAPGAMAQGPGQAARSSGSGDDSNNGTRKPSRPPNVSGQAANSPESLVSPDRTNRKIPGSPQSRLTIGQNNTGIGQNNTGIGQNNLAIGQNNTGIGPNNMTIGQNNMAIGQNNMAIGQNNTGIGPNNMAIGQNNTGIGQNNMAIGQNNTGIGPNNMGISPNNMGIGQNNTGIGQRTLGIHSEPASFGSSPFNSNNLFKPYSVPTNDSWFYGHSTSKSPP